MNTRYENARADYAAIGVDTEAALAALATKSISMHCWQGDDVRGFEGNGSLDGGIQTTGNYPGAARTPAELMADIDAALALIPGTHRLNLHASYAIFAEGEAVDRDQIEPRHFAPWVEFAHARGMGIDFNPTCFSHPKAAVATLSSNDDEIRRFWIDHCIACLRIAEYFATELGTPSLVNIWIPDGMKDTPADRYAPRARFAASLDEILACGYDKSKVYVSLESKVFGIGLESYTVGSAEFCLSYAASRGLVPLMDNGHYHPTEVVSDKLPAMYLFYPTVALHVTRGVRWDSDHVVRLDDETIEMAREIVRCDALDRTLIGLDFFDASINRVAAWVIGMRNMQKALLQALLTPHKALGEMQERGDGTALLAAQEDLKTMPWGAVWAEYCRRANVPADGEWMDDVRVYENKILGERA